MSIPHAEQIITTPISINNFPQAKRLGPFKFSSCFGEGESASSEAAKTEVTGEGLKSVGDALFFNAGAGVACPELAERVGAGVGVFEGIGVLAGFEVGIGVGVLVGVGVFVSVG